MALAVAGSLVTLAIAARTRDVFPGSAALPASSELTIPLDERELPIQPAEALHPAAPEIAARAGESDGGPTRPAQDRTISGHPLPTARPSAEGAR